jgi:hypothetical protein
VLQIGKVPDHPQQERGHVVVVDHIGTCNLCGGAPGRWDVRTRDGYWANLCDSCAEINAASKETGVGKGQLWITSS